MSNLTSQKPDYMFIASLIIIIGVAVFLAMDRFKDTKITEYLNQTGQKLLAQINDANERKDLQSEYDKFLKKVEEREVDPEKVKQFVSKIINLDQVKNKMDKDEFTYILQSNLQEVNEPDTVTNKYREDSEKWAQLKKRLMEINVFETKVKDALKAKPAISKKYSFSYTIDDTLNIILNEDFKKNIEKVKLVGLTDELKRIENEKILKWKIEIDTVKKNEKELQRELLNLKNIKATVSAFHSLIDSLPGSPTPPVNVDEVPNATE